MDAFSYLSVLLSIILGLAITQVLQGFRGLMLARSPFWDEVLAPLILALNSLPRIALAPLIILWFGIGITAKVVTAFTLVFFILMVNTLGGAKNVDNDILTIARLMGASKRDILWQLFPKHDSEQNRELSAEAAHNARQNLAQRSDCLQGCRYVS